MRSQQHHPPDADRPAVTRFVPLEHASRRARIRDGGTPSVGARRGADHQNEPRDRAPSAARRPMRSQQHQRARMWRVGRPRLRSPPTTAQESALASHRRAHLVSRILRRAHLGSRLPPQRTPRRSPPTAAHTSALASHHSPLASTRIPVRDSLHIRSFRSRRSRRSGRSRRSRRQQRRPRLPASDPILKRQRRTATVRVEA